MEIWEGTLAGLAGSGPVNLVYLLGVEEPEQLPEGCAFIRTEGQFSTDTVRKIADHSAGTGYSLIITRETRIDFGWLALERFLTVAGETGTGMLYADHFDRIAGKLIPHPVVDYQAGSLRDDFDFGPVLFFRSRALIEAARGFQESLSYAGLYQLRLAVSRQGLPMRIPESLYETESVDNRASGKKMFDYVDPHNRSVQEDMERAVTTHLRQVGGWLAPEFEPVHFDEETFPVEASVIIPVLDRERTVAGAIESVMSQETGFDYNLILVDNHSTDRTTHIVKELAEKYSNLIHVIPEREDLGIGGCWNVAIHHPACGKFAVQLDSDDLYRDKYTLKQMVRAFYEQQCAMVIGSYQMTNFQLEEIPPGIVDHREWTPGNGRNNALRINGLGAPRAFYTPLLRKINLPNVSYGEDYAVGLAISRRYRIGRIYTPNYLCRRWDDNSDASLSIEALNRHNLYKDRIRTFELQARIKLNSERS